MRHHAYFLCKLYGGREDIGQTHAPKLLNAIDPPCRSARHSHSVYMERRQLWPSDTIHCAHVVQCEIRW